MVKKTLLANAVLALTAVLLLSGCYTADTIKKGVDEVCAATDKERQVLKTEVDKITAPHQVRITCNAES